MRTALFLLILISPVLAQPTIDHNSPTAISSKGGQITLHGSGLKEPLSLWPIPAAEATFSDVSPDSGFFQNAHDHLRRINLCVGAFPNNHITAHGSAGWKVTADRRKIEGSYRQNKSFKQPQPIQIPAAIEGSADELTSHFYKFSAHKNKTLSVDVLANRIGSKLDPLVRLLDSNGKELVFCDDDPAIAPDSRFFYLIPNDADYILELRDAAYEGSKEHRFRLRVKETDTIEIPPPSTRHYPTTLPTTTEQEPNDTPAAATPFQFPAQLQGKFDKPHDRDIYQFTAKIGDHLLVHSKTRSIASPCDLFLRLAKPNGAKLADSKTDTADEASLDATIPEDGTYLLIVEELIGQSGPAMFYQLDVDHFAGFFLTTDTEKLDIPAGSQAEIKVTAMRRAYKGSITFSIDSDIPDLGVSGSMDEDKNETQLKIKIRPNAPVGKAFSFRLVDHANINGQNYSQPVSTYAALKKLFPLMHYPPPQLEDEIGLGIKPPAPTTTTAPAKP